MNLYKAELHVHTVLSPCAEVEMIPPLIVRQALELGIRIIAITDHNVTANIKAVQTAAQGTELVVLPGMELQTLEEVHLLCLFDDLETALAWQNQVDRALPSMKNRPDYFGEQFIVDETGDFIRREHRLLITSAKISLDEAVTQVHQLGGLAIPAHVDRKAFGLIANLGFVPQHLSIEALEISMRLDPVSARKTYPQLGDFTLIQGGDAHRLSEIKGANRFMIAAPTIQEIRMALRGEAERYVEIHTNS